MTEQEARLLISQKMLDQAFTPSVDEALLVIFKELEQLAMYRAIGTVEQFKELKNGK